MLDRGRVHVVDDDDDLRESLKALLDAAGFRCSNYASARAFLEAGATSGCALVDVRMPEVDGLALLNELSSRKSRLPVIIMTGFADVPLAVRAMKAGAVDFVEKPTPPEVLIGAVRRALERAQASDAAQPEARARLDRLTDRETDVLKLLVVGDSNKVVAHKLGISSRTVEIHRARLMEKLEAAKLADLVRLALAAGLESQQC
jgi:two-component system response regulator FixJ